MNIEVYEILEKVILIFKDSLVSRNILCFFFGKLIYLFIYEYFLF